MLHLKTRNGYFPIDSVPQSREAWFDLVRESVSGAGKWRTAAIDPTILEGWGSAEPKSVREDCGEQVIVMEFLPVNPADIEAFGGDPGCSRVAAFNHYPSGEWGLGSVRSPELFAILMPSIEDLMAFTRHLLELADTPIREMTVGGVPGLGDLDSHYGNLLFDYDIDKLGCLYASVSPRREIDLPLLTEPFFLHDIQTVVPSQRAMFRLFEAFASAVPNITPRLHTGAHCGASLLEL